jgi:hypothetical protein
MSSAPSSSDPEPGRDDFGSSDSMLALREALGGRYVLEVMPIIGSFGRNDSIPRADRPQRKRRPLRNFTPVSNPRLYK